MLQNNPAILITGETGDVLVEQMTSKGFVVDVIPFIKTESIQTKKVQQQVDDISNLNTTVVFTSSNAVNAVHEYIQNKNVTWKIYCVGNATRLLIEKLFNGVTIVALADNAIALSEKIIADNPLNNQLYFFCGDKKRDELPGMLSKNNIVVNEIEVYTTTIFQHTIKKDYDAVVFFSPSAVDGFFKNNSLNNKTVLFAIGNTTAGEIKKFSKNEIIVSDAPAKKYVIEKVIQFLKK